MLPITMNIPESSGAMRFQPLSLQPVTNARHEWVLEEACSQARIWEQNDFRPVKLAVNISARQISSKLPGIIAALLSRHRLTPAWLELELTESMLMNNTESVISTMDELMAMINGERRLVDA